MAIIHRIYKSYSKPGGRLFLASCVAALCSFGICAPVALSQGLPAAPHAKVINITPQPGFFTEPSIAVNTLNPKQVVAAYQDNAHIAYSTDAGKTWDTASGTAPPDWRVSGDVSVTYDKFGHAILCYMAFDKLGTFNYWAHNDSRNGLFVRRSLDGGKTWESQHAPVIQQVTAPGIPFEDKPYIVTDNSSGPHSGNLYVGWTRWTIEDSQILLSRSTDDGRTWSAPLEITKQRGLPRDDNGAAEGFSGVVGPDSTLYAVWAMNDSIVFTYSKDGGVSFSPPQNIIHVAPIMFHVDAVARANGFPVIAMAPRNSRLYVTWSDYRNGEVDVFCSSSADHGRTWSEATRVNSDAVHDGADHFFHWLAVDPANGDVDVVYYDRRDDPGNRRMKVVLARSTDGGKTFTNYAWMNEAFDPAGVFMGDYTGIAALAGRVYGVWTEKPDTARGRDTIIRVGVADFAP